MLKKAILTAAAALFIAGGATALQPAPAEAGVSIQFVHGKGHKAHKGHKGHRFHRRGPRYGNFGRYFGGRNFCFTTYRTVKVKRWQPRRHRWVMKSIRRPVRICR